MAVHDLLMAAASGSSSKARPIYVNTGTRNNATGSGSLVVNKPANVLVGDIIVVFASGGANNRTWTAPSAAWTEVLDAGTSMSPAVFWKVATSNDETPGSYTFPSNSGGSAYNGFAIAYRGGAFDVLGTPAVTGSSNATSVSAPSITVSENSSILLAVYFTDTSNSVVSSAPTGMSLRASDGTRPTSLIYSQDVEAGSTGTRTITYTNGTTLSGVLASIKPA